MYEGFVCNLQEKQDRSGQPINSVTCSLMQDFE